MPEDAADQQSLPVIGEDGLLLHIGVFKTGTTALQEALRAAAPALTEAGVLFRGPASWKWQRLLDLMREDAPDGAWQELEAAVRAHPGRAMVSSENLCGATDAEAAEVVRRLGAGRPVTVLMTVRSLSGLLASTWQQFLKRGVHQPFEDWLHEVLDRPGAPDQLFWRRNDFPAQVRRWGGLVGAENVVVAVSDKAFPTRNLEIVEDLLGLPRGAVELRPETRSNRSMTFAESEVLRRVNEAVQGDLRGDAYRRLVRLGVFPAMHAVDGAADVAIPVPQWAGEAAGAVGAAQARELRESPATIVGDIDMLGQARWDVTGSVVPPAAVDLELAVAAVVGGLRAAQRDSGRKKSAAPAAPAGRGGLRGILRRS